MDSTSANCGCGCNRNSGNTVLGVILGAVAVGAIVLAGAAGYAYGQENTRGDRPATVTHERSGPSAGQQVKPERRDEHSLEHHEEMMKEMRDLLSMLAFMQQMHEQYPPMPMPPMPMPPMGSSQLPGPSSQSSNPSWQDPSATSPAVPQENWEYPSQAGSATGTGERTCVTMPNQGGVTTWCVGGWDTPQPTQGSTQETYPSQPGAQGQQHSGGPWPGFVPRPK